MSDGKNKLFVVGVFGQLVLRAILVLSGLATLVVGGFGVLLLLKPMAGKMMVLPAVMAVVVMFLTLFGVAYILLNIVKNNDILASSELWSRQSGVDTQQDGHEAKKISVWLLVPLVFLFVFVLFRFVGGGCSSADSPKAESLVLPEPATAQATVNTPTGLPKDLAVDDGEVAEVAEHAPSAEEVPDNGGKQEDSGLAMMLATASVALEANEIERAKTLYQEICELGSKEACVILKRLKSTAQAEDTGLQLPPAPVVLDPSRARQLSESALTLLKAKDYKAAIANWLAAIGLAPNLESAYPDLGYAYLKAGQYENCVRVGSWCTAKVVSKRLLGACYYNEALCRLKTNDRAGAVDALERSLANRKNAAVRRKLEALKSK
jgi:hypothetical protein